MVAVHPWLIVALLFVEPRSTGESEGIGPQGFAQPEAQAAAAGIYSQQTINRQQIEQS
jgi:hypothetical protein